MQCNTNYTGSINNFNFINLNVLKTYKKLFPKTVLGLSDHTPGHETVLGGIALGAKVIEKHFTDDNSRPGPDHPFSMNPKTWREMIDRSRLLEKAMGLDVKKVEENEKETVVLQRRAVRAIVNINSNQAIKRSMVEFQRPCPKNALKPNEFSKYVGKKMKKNVSIGGYLKKSFF
tara:strand:- start:114 stop:635 length:522 start_codon:yes stop_codon:yes gene_type:complete